MIIKLLPEQVAKYWDVVKKPLMETLPGDSITQHGLINNILEGLMIDKIQCWWYVKQDIEKDSIDILAQVLTTIFVDDCIKLRTLRIYELYSYGILPEEAWAVGKKAFEKYAKGHDCQFIDFFTSHPGIIKLAGRSGFNVEQVHGIMEVK